RIGAMTRRAIGAQLDEIREQLVALRASLGEVERHVSEGAAQTAAWRDESVQRQQALEERLWPLLRALVEEEAANRRRLFAVGGTAGYERAYTEPEPLVSITVVTHDRVDLLTKRALPSLLAQTYTNLEVIVAGDHAPPEVEAAVLALGDSRISYFNL